MKLTNLELLEQCVGRLNGLIASELTSDYISERKQAAQLCWEMGRELEAAYHLSEAQAAGLRHTAMYNADYFGQRDHIECLSYHSEYSKSEANGLLKRLNEMPTEWTIVQLNCGYDPMDAFRPRKIDEPFKIETIYLSRFPCGSELERGEPFTVVCPVPTDTNENLIQCFHEISEMGSLTHGTRKQLIDLRTKASENAERLAREMGNSLFQDSLAFLLGKLIDKELETEIKLRIDHILNKYHSNPKKIPKRQRYMLYLLAEGCGILSESDISLGLCKIFDGQNLEELEDQLCLEMENIKNSNSSLPMAKRHPVLLALDDRLEIVSWESMIELKGQPISRIYSVHFAHFLFHVHKNHIKNGLRHVYQPAYYLLDPKNELKMSFLVEFVKKRFPEWKGWVGQEPNNEQFIEALTRPEIFLYCGHGSGFQYMKSVPLGKVSPVNPVQFLFGCSSVGLKDNGSYLERTADVHQYILSGSGCTVGMIWPVTSKDADLMTISMLNVCFPGSKIDPKTHKIDPDPQKEYELLRGLHYVREACHSFSNGAAIVARGIPIKFLTNEN